MLITRASDPAAPILVMGHGAGAGEGHPWMRRVADGLAERGVSVITFDFPYMAAKRRVPDAAPVLETAFAEMWRATVTAHDAAQVRPRACFAGGKSMGGRISSQAAARGLFDPAPVGLVFFGYPLHPPGKPAVRRDRHLPEVGMPMLFLHGERDPFGAPDEMQDLASRLTNATLHLVPGGDHSLVAPKRADPSGQSLTTALDVAAKWMRAMNLAR